MYENSLARRLLHYNNDLFLGCICLIEQLFLYEELTKRQIELTIHRGQEVRLVEDLLTKLQNNEVITLADSKYLLLELPSNNHKQLKRNGGAFFKYIVEDGLLKLITSLFIGKLKQLYTLKRAIQ